MNVIRAWLIFFSFTASVQAAIVDTFQFMDVESVGLAGDSSNVTLTSTSTATGEYTLGMFAWAGTASATPDPLDPTVVPTWGGDLSLRVTHVPSGTQAEFVLGSGGEFPAEPTVFAGASRALGGLPITPGDQFLFEFLEGFDDPVVSPDAVWNSIVFSLSDDAASPPGPPGEGFVRLATIGRNTFPTAAGEEGAEFFRLDYGHGDGPAIAQAVLNTHAVDRDDVWFDSDETGNSPETQGTFQANFLDGVGVRQVSFQAEDPDSAFAGDFATLRLSFEPGGYLPGGAMHFGIDTDGGFTGPPTGDAFAMLDPRLTFTVLFDDGTLAASDDWQVRQDVESAAQVEVDIRERTLRADVDADGDVDGHDLVDMFLHFGATRTASHAEGDTDGDGSVDSVDLLAWKQQVGQRFSIGGRLRTRGVPEPSAAIATMIFVGSLLMCRAMAKIENAKRNPH